MRIEEKKSARRNRNIKFFEIVIHNTRRRLLSTRSAVSSSKSYGFSTLIHTRSIIAVRSGETTMIRRASS